MNIHTTLAKINDMDARIEALQDQRDEFVDPLERDAKLIHKARGGRFQRSTSSMRFREHKAEKNVLVFEVYDSYDDTFEDWAEIPIEDFEDVRETIKKIEAEHDRKVARKAADQAKRDRAQYEKLKEQFG